MLNGKQRLIGFFFFVFICALVIILINADQVFNDVEKVVSPYIKYDKDEHCNATSFGTADAKAIRNIHINWERGDILIKYSSQQRITWVETFVKGEPTQYNTQYYWMNSHTLFIEFSNQDYFSMNQNSRQDIHKNLTLTIPQGIELNELVVHNTQGQVNVEVQCKTKDIRYNP